MVMKSCCAVQPPGSGSHALRVHVNLPSDINAKVKKYTVFTLERYNTVQLDQ